MQIIAFFDRYRKWNNKRTTLLQRTHIYMAYITLYGILLPILYSVSGLYSVDIIIL